MNYAKYSVLSISIGLVLKLPIEIFSKYYIYDVISDNTLS